ncbi:YceI family protein [Sphingomonas spermidinifaciens]|nr:YceI family protein [Sphingomonas spermidinifaciens]
MMMLSALLAMLGGFLQPAERRYAVDPARSTVNATVGFFGIGSKTARFPRVDGAVTVGEGGVRLDVRLDAAALKASDGVTERRLKGENFFDVGRYPVVSFAGAGLKPTGPAAGTIQGNLTARGVTRPVTLEVRFSRPVAALGSGERFHVSAKTEIDRRDFGMTAYPVVVGRRVRIVIEADLQPSG